MIGTLLISVPMSEAAQSVCIGYSGLVDSGVLVSTDKGCYALDDLEREVYSA